jgi:hypothetical protein
MWRCWGAPLGLSFHFLSVMAFTSSSASLVSASVWFGLAASAGASSWSVRVSRQSVSGSVVVVSFGSRAAARRFAAAAAGVVGRFVVVRWSGFGWAASVPCAGVLVPSLGRPRLAAGVRRRVAPPVLARRVG